MAENSIDLEGQKIQLGEDFVPGKFDMSDAFSMIMESIKKSDLWAHANKTLKINEFLYSLKKGEIHECYN